MVARLEAETHTETAAQPAVGTFACELVFSEELDYLVESYCGGHPRILGTPPGHITR